VPAAPGAITPRPVNEEKVGEPPRRIDPPTVLSTSGLSALPSSDPPELASRLRAQLVSDLSGQSFVPTGRSPMCR
jgi:hypothetical protein